MRSLFTLLLFVPFVGFSQYWQQQGQDIDGEAANDDSGYSVSMNAAGDMVAIGAYDNDGNGVNAGHVRIYAWNGTSWVQQGQDIDGEYSGDRFGWSVSMNAEGDRLAVGARLHDGSMSNRGHVRIYEWDGTLWTQLGQDIDGEAANDESGRSVSMNAAGDRVAIGAPYHGGDAGHVKIYAWDGTSWTQQGQDIDGEAASLSLGLDGDQSGWSVSINAAGDRVAIGARYNAGNGYRAGHVRIYDWNGSSWVQQGQDIDGEAAGDYSGVSVSMNSSGDRVAIGADGNDGNSGNVNDNRGHVRIYEWNGTSWIQQGQDIDGEAAGDVSGWSVSTNAVGDRVAIGAIWNDGNGNDAGHVRIFDWNGSSWVQQGQDIDGEAADDWAGFVSLNAVGSSRRILVTGHAIKHATI